MTLPIAKASYFEGISFRPEGWAERQNADLVARIDQLRSEAARLSEMVEAHPLAPELLEALIERHGRATQAYWLSMSRCMSPMITGPARFPVERNRKRTDVADRRLQEVGADFDRALRALQRAAFPHGMPGDAIRGDDPDAIAKLEAKLSSGVKYAERKRLEDRLTALKTRQARGRVERECDAFKVVEDPDLDRIQLVFEGRPDDATRAILKGRGFRWAPSQGAWQRHLNANGRALPLATSRVT